MDALDFGMPKTYKNRSGNDVTEWPDGLKLVRFADGRVKDPFSAVAHAESVLRSSAPGATPPRMSLLRWTIQRTSSHRAAELNG